MSSDANPPPPSAETVANAFIDLCRKELAPKTRTGSLPSMRVILTVLLMICAPLALPLTGIYLFDVNKSEAPNARFLIDDPSSNTAPDTAAAEKKEVAYKKSVGDTNREIALSCIGGDTCGPKEFSAAKEAAAALREAAAGKSGRVDALSEYSGKLLLIIGTLSFLLISTCLLAAQARLTWRFWSWSCEGYRENMPRDPVSYTRMSDLNGFRFCFAIGLPIVFALGLKVVFQFSETQISLTWQWIWIILMASFLIICLSAILRTPGRTPIGSFAPAYILAIAAIIGVSSIDIGRAVVPSFAIVADQFGGWFVFTASISAALVCMTTAISYWGVQIYREPYPTPWGALRIFHAYRAFVEREEELERAKTHVPQIVTGSGTAPKRIDQEYWPWNRMLQVINDTYILKGNTPERLPVDNSLKPSQLRSAARALTMTLAIVLVLALVLIALFTESAVSGLSAGSDTLKSELETAVSRFLLFVGFGFSGIVAANFLLAEERLIPYQEEEEDSGSSSSKSSDSSEAPIPWNIAQRTSTGIETIIEPIGHVLKDDWPASEIKKRDEEAKAKLRKNARKNLSPKLADHIGMNYEKLDIVLKGSQRGGGVQSAVNANAKQYVVPLITLLAPAVTGSFLALLN